MGYSMIPHSRPWIDESDLRAVRMCLESGMLAEGRAHAALESALAEKFGFAHAFAVGSGCQALQLALRACGAGPGRRVVVPTYVCPEVLGTIEACGAQAVLSDIGEDYSVDPSDSAVTNAGPDDLLVLPFLFGANIDITRYARFAGRLVLDWAQYLPRHAEIVPESTIAILSFEATKPLTGGEGGAVLVRDDALAQAIARQREVPGTNRKLNLYPLSDLQCALIQSQLARYDEFVRRRLAIAARYDAAISGSGKVARPVCAANGVPFRYILQIRAAELAADDAIAAFAARGIVVRRPVDVLLHTFRPASRAFPVAQRLFDRTISIPLYPALDDAEAELIARACGEIFA